MSNQNQNNKPGQQQPSPKPGQKPGQGGPRK
jgi:hypothetical protein